MKRKISLVLAFVMVIAVFAIVVPVTQVEVNAIRSGNGFEGVIDQLDGRMIRGWGWRPGAGNHSVDIHIHVNDAVTGELLWTTSPPVRANTFRQDLLNHTRSRGGTGNYAFSINWNLGALRQLLRGRGVRIRVALVDPRSPTQNLWILDTFWGSPFAGVSSNRPEGFGNRAVSVRMGTSVNTNWAAAYRRGMNHWSNSAAGVSIGESSGSNNVLHTISDTSERAFGWIVGPLAPGTGRMTRFDITLNTHRITQEASIVSPVTPNQAAASNIATSVVVHEFGHAFWLDDNPMIARGMSNTPRTVMCGNRNRNSMFTPQTMDVNNVIVAYQFMTRLERP